MVPSPLLFFTGASAFSLDSSTSAAAVDSSASSISSRGRSRSSSNRSSTDGGPPDPNKVASYYFSPPDTFFLSTSASTSTSSLTFPVLDAVHHSHHDRLRRHLRVASASAAAMPSSTLTAPDGAASFLPDANANVNILAGPWRPKSAASARDAGPLFNRWTRANKHHARGQSPSNKHAAAHRAGSSSSHSFSGPAARHGSLDRGSLGPESKRQSQTLTREEFEALPIAIQRKVRELCHTYTHTHTHTHPHTHTPTHTHMHAAIHIHCHFISLHHHLSLAGRCLCLN